MRKLLFTQCRLAEHLLCAFAFKLIVGAGVKRELLVFQMRDLVRIERTGELKHHLAF